MCLFSPRVIRVGALVFVMVTFDGMNPNHKGVIPKYTEVLDEMTTGTCVALEVRRESNNSARFRTKSPHDAHARRSVSRITITIELVKLKLAIPPHHDDRDSLVPLS